ncbi:MAG: proline/glycine betaine ABC transporter permease [Albidovulum sp.]
MTEPLEAFKSFVLDPFNAFDIPTREIIATVVGLIISAFRGFCRAYISPPIEGVMGTFQWLLGVIHPLIFVAGTFLVGWKAASMKIGLFSAIGLLVLGFMGVWVQMIFTLSLVLTAVVFSVLLGLPLGILCSRSDRFYRALRPILDIMQTTPPFVYLIPAVMLFGIGDVPGLIATIVFAIPPMIRLTNLGIRQVGAEYMEAARAFGSTDTQILVKVQIPLALPTIMAGLNQTIMLSLSMAVIAAIIGAGGLGFEVFAGLQRLNIGQAFVGGIGIVILAMILDRITQGAGEKMPGTRRRGMG